MKAYTYSEARQKLSEILDIACSEEVIMGILSGIKICRISPPQS